MSHTRKVKIMDVSPDVAERWLNESNTHNRPLRNSLVAKYADAMRRGDWRLTAEPIAFSAPYVDSKHDRQGVTLLNGQHRLYAIVESGTTVPLTVWWGCEATEFAVIDQGASRTIGDILATTRTDLLPEVTQVATVCCSVARFGFGVKGNSSVAGGKRAPIHMSFARIELIMRELEPEILAVAAYKKHLKRAARGLISPLVLAQIINPAMTATIVEQLHSSVGFTERDPIRALHVYLAERALSSTKDSEEAMHVKICHAIAARLRGDSLKHLRITTEGLGWLRDGAKPRINGLVAALHNGEVPRSFYKPVNTFAEGEA